METWENLKKEITSISEHRKEEITLAAKFVSAITRRRKELKLSQRELARLTGLKQSTIARIESGAVIPRFDTLLSLAIHLKLTISIAPDNTK